VSHGVPDSAMNDKLAISNHLSAVLQDWRGSRAEFPCNDYRSTEWPIPFFGNPATTLVATVGVNPSSGEFRGDRNWNVVKNPADWKRRLKNYFNHDIPPHEWFVPWQIGLKLIGMSYQAGSAAHFDVSYRPTKAMLKNKSTDSKEFRSMVERDVAWFFRLLPLCEHLRVLLVFGPVVRANGTKESLFGFLKNRAPRHGFSVLQNGNLEQTDTGRIFTVYEVDTPGEKCITCRVVKNLLTRRADLRRIINRRFTHGQESH
jgi:hypothetical protein